VKLAGTKRDGLGTAERALTDWSCRKFIKRRQIFDMYRAGQQRGQLSEHLLPGIVENSAEK
jgi:hypothetical protein